MLSNQPTQHMWGCLSRNLCCTCTEMVQGDLSLFIVLQCLDCFANVASLQCACVSVCVCVWPCVVFHVRAYVCVCACVCGGKRVRNERSVRLAWTLWLPLNFNLYLHSIQRRPPPYCWVVWALHDFRGCELTQVHAPRTFILRNSFEFRVTTIWPHFWVMFVLSFDHFYDILLSSFLNVFIMIFVTLLVLFFVCFLHGS